MPIEPFNGNLIGLLYRRQLFFSTLCLGFKNRTDPYGHKKSCFFRAAFL